jgi:hypothetical protein
MIWYVIGAMFGGTVIGYLLANTLMNRLLSVFLNQPGEFYKKLPDDQLNIIEACLSNSTQALIAERRSRVKTR